MQRFTVDVEDYRSLVVRDKLGIDIPVFAGVDNEMVRLLDLLDEFEVSATCFVVGRLAAERPHVVREIARRGHEIGSHGYRHIRMKHLSPREFSEDLRTSIQVIESITGAPVRGFRAPAFSLGMRERWAFEIMAEEGILFDSSVRVVWPLGKRVAAAMIEAATACGVEEFPGVAVGVSRFRIPLAGGGGLRHVPDWFTRWGVRRVCRAGHSVPTYVHPYDLSVEPEYGGWPSAPLTKAVRLAWFDWLQRRGREKVAARLERIASEPARVSPASKESIL